MTQPQYTESCPGWTSETPDVVYRQSSKCDDIAFCWDYDDPAPLQGWRIWRSTTPPSIDTRQLCVSVGIDNVVVDSGDFSNELRKKRQKIAGDPIFVENVIIGKGTPCGDINQLWTDTGDNNNYGVCLLNSGGNFTLELDEPILGIDQLSWRFQVTECCGGRAMYLYDKSTDTWLAIGGGQGGSFQTINHSNMSSDWTNGVFTKIRFVYGGRSSASLSFKVAYLKLWKNGVQYQFDSSSSPSFPVTGTDGGPFSPTAGVNHIKLNRDLGEYITADAGDHYALGTQNFTLDFWFSKSDTPRVYHFPCETLIGCYDADSDMRAWRIWIEPPDVTASQGATTGSTFSTLSADTANLMFEMYENGDGTGAHTVIKIITLDDTGSPSPNTIATGLNNFTQVCLIRDGNVFLVYIDGVLQYNWTSAQGIAYNSNQYLLFGRHFGDSGRLNPSVFNGPVPGKDGDASSFDGSLADIRLLRGYSIYPPPGGTGPGICGNLDWPSTFSVADTLPPGRRCWTDPSPPLGGLVYYKVAAVQCDIDNYTICPEYLAAKVINRQQLPSYAVDNPIDLANRQAIGAPTLRNVFDTWDRSSPARNEFFEAPNTGSGHHSNWYYDVAEQTFIQPDNTDYPVMIISPSDQYQTSYTHRAILYSDNVDDDAIGVVGAYHRDPVTQKQYALVFLRTNAGLLPFDGWGARVISTEGSSIVFPRDDDRQAWDTTGSGLDVGSTDVHPPGNGWNGRTTAVEVVRSRNVITARCSTWRGASARNYELHHESFMDDSKTITIDLDQTPPPPGINGGWGPFQGPTGYGFYTASQANSRYFDWNLYPYPGSKIYDFSLGYPGRVWELGTNDKWYLTMDTAWESAGSVPTEFLDIVSGERHVVECDEVYFKV